MATVSPRKSAAVTSSPLLPVGASLKRSSSKASLTEPKPKRKRTKAGCITCRVRGKKCDESKAIDGPGCETCKRLRLHCLGFTDRRPDWLRSKENIKIWRKRVTDFLLSQGLVKGHAGCGLRPGSVADASLTLDDMRRDLDHYGGRDADSPSGPLQDHERDMEPETPQGFGNMHGHGLTLPPLQNVPRSGSPHEDPVYIRQRFEHAMNGIDDQSRVRWVPDPPFSPLKTSTNLGDGLPPVNRPDIGGPNTLGSQGPMLYDPRFTSREVNPGHASRLSSSSNPGSHNRSHSPVANTLPPLHRVLSAHDRDRVDHAYANNGTGPSSGGYSVAPPNYSDMSRTSSMYNSTPTLSSSVSHGSSFPPTPGVAPGYGQPPPHTPGYGSEPGHSSAGAVRYPLRHDPTQQSTVTQPTASHKNHYHPYPIVNQRASFTSQSSENDSPPVSHVPNPLSLRTSIVRGSADTSPTQYQSSSAGPITSASEQYNNGFGMPYGYTTTNSAMSIQGLLHASSSSVSTPVTAPPISALTPIVPTPTTGSYPNTTTNAVGQNNNNTMVGPPYYPNQYSFYGPNQDGYYTPLILQPAPAPDSSQFYINRYFTDVIGIQYRLANQRTLPSLMLDLSERSQAVKASISLLSVLHFEAQQLAQAGIAGSVLGDSSGTNGQTLDASNAYPNQYMLGYSTLNLGVPGVGFINSSSLLPASGHNPRALYDLLYARIKKLLEEAKISKGDRYDEGDAMACLHVISAFLFSGGRGNWDQFLQIAGDWVESRLMDYRNDVTSALREMASIERFIFRTTMWMDVFGSISLCRTPRFLDLYRTIFRPGLLDFNTSVAIETNMDRVMGCPNEIILAFAMIADLEARKNILVNAYNDGFRSGVPKEMANYAIRMGWSPNQTDLVFLWQDCMRSVEAEGVQIERTLPESYGPSALPVDRIIEVHSQPVQQTAHAAQTVPTLQSVPTGPSSVPTVPAQSRSQSQPHSQNLEFSGVDANILGGGPATVAEDYSWYGSNAASSSAAGTSRGIGTAAGAAMGANANVSPLLINSPSPSDESATYVDPDEDKRGKIAEVFRNAARVYLHSVISGCDPLKPKTRRAVLATIRALEVLGASPLDRSLIFPITITGCLAGTLAEANFCIGRLSSVGADAESFGNCFAARQLIRRVWEKRANSGYVYRDDYDYERISSQDGGGLKGSDEGALDASWRTVMREMSENPLLLV